MNSSRPQHTIDVISDRLKIRQSRKGYRFGLDALLLSTDGIDVNAIDDLGATHSSIGENPLTVAAAGPPGGAGLGARLRCTGRCCCSKPC